MVLTALDKGKGKAIQATHQELSESGNSSASVSSSESDTSSESGSEDDITPEYLESLIEKARQNAAASRKIRPNDNDVQEEDIIKLSGSTKE
jgi:hypothetical protein